MQHLLRFFLLLTLTIAVGFSKAATINFSNSYASAIAESKSNNKLVYVYFTDSSYFDMNQDYEKIVQIDKIANFYNENFICVRLYTNSKEAKLFQQKFSTKVFPAHLFINSHEELVHKAVGSYDAVGFLNFGFNAVSPDNNLQNLNHIWNSDRKQMRPEALGKYITVLMDAGEDFNEPAKFFLQNIGDQELQQPELSNLVLTLTSDVYSESFKLLCSKFQTINFGPETEHAKFEINGKISFHFKMVVIKGFKGNLQDSLQKLCNYLEWGNSEQLILLTELELSKYNGGTENIYTDILMRFLTNYSMLLPEARFQDYIIELSQSKNYYRYCNQCINWCQEQWDRTQNPESLLLLSYANYAAGRLVEAKDFFNMSQQIAQEQNYSILSTTNYFKNLMPGI